MQINGLFAAKPRPFGPRNAPSSIIKSPIAQLTVSFNGTEEDEQGNKKLHGGPEKVLHQYGPLGYEQLKAAYPKLADQFQPGTIGENIVVNGMEDVNVHVGDKYKLGQVLVQVSAPRAPCNKISHRFKERNLDRFVGKQGITGWYYRVLEPGIIRLGDTVERVERTEASVSIHNLVKTLFAEKPKVEVLLQYGEMKVLDDEWKQKCLSKAKKLTVK